MMMMMVCVVLHLGVSLSHDSACQGTVSLFQPITPYGLYADRLWELSTLTCTSLVPFAHLRSLLLVAVLYTTTTIQEGPGTDLN